MEEKDLKSQSLDQLLKLMVTLTDEVVEMHAMYIDRRITKKNLTKLQVVQMAIIEKKNQVTTL